MGYAVVDSEDCGARSVPCVAALLSLASRTEKPDTDPEEMHDAGVVSTALSKF
jgi:hypothetical protein